MAETRTKKAKATKKSSAASSKGKTKSRAKSASTKQRSSPQSAQRNGSSSGRVNGLTNGVGDGAKAVRDAVGSAGKEAGHAVGKAKVPLLAGGAAVAGTVGGLVLGASRSGDKVLGVTLPKSKRVKLSSRDLSKAAKEVGRFGENVGELTSELKRAREGLANGDGNQRSPIEVLLRGLTARR